MNKRWDNLTNILKIVLLVSLIFGTVAKATISTTLSPNSSVSGSTVDMNFTVNDTTNSTSWFNITFPSQFNVISAIINMIVNGQPASAPTWNNTTGILFINVSSGTTVAYSGNTTYINLSNVTLPVIGGVSSTFTINVETNNGVTVPLDYSVVATRGISLTNISALSSSTMTSVNATYLINLTNTGDSQDSYTLTVVKGGASIADLNISTPTGNLASGESLIFALNVTNSSVGTFLVNVTAQSVNDSSKSGSVNTTTIVSSPPVRGVTLTNISVLDKSTSTGINATYLLNLTNTGNSLDTITLTVTGDTATVASVNLTSVPLSAGVSKILSFNVTNTTQGILHINVTATSSDTITKASVNTTTYVQSSLPESTSYWGNVSRNNISSSGAQVTVHKSTGAQIANSTSNGNGQYNVIVSLDTLVSGENITFKVDGRIAGTVAVAAQGTNNRLDLYVDTLPPVITIFYPVNDSSISIFDRTINGSITDNSSISANLSVGGMLSNTWTAKGNFSWIANYSGGDIPIVISATDAYNNTNISTTIVHIIPPTNVTTNIIPANNSTNILANSSTGVDLVLTTGNNSADVNVSIIASTNASDFNASTISNGLGRYVDINATGETENLTSVKLTMFYNHLDLDRNGNGAITDPGDIDENSLTLYWYWDNISAGGAKWLPLTTGTNYASYLDANGTAGPVVIGNTVRNTSGNYLSVTLNHFSIYTISGTVIPTPPTGCVTNCGGSSGSSGGGGGGGGGGGSAENYSNIQIKEKVDLHVFKDKLTSYAFKSADPIVNVNIIGNINAGEVTTTVEVLKNTSSLVKAPAPGLVYKNVNIWVGTSGFATSKNIKEGTIVFRILNSWMSDNKVKSSDVKLVKWDGSKWTTLETSEKSKDGTHTYFEGKTTLFSHFAITASVSEISPTPAPISPEVPKETPKVTATTPAKGTPAIPGWMALIMAVAAYFIGVRKKEGDKK